MTAPCPVIVMAKAPVAGFSKTRLIPALGAATAAQLAERLLCHAVGEATAAQIGPVELCCTPDATHPTFERLAKQHAITLRMQGGGDLGARMDRALQRALAVHTRALLMGTDIPGIDAAVLRNARSALDTHDAVFVPALDGGYALVGLRAAAPGLFGGMVWSTPQVMDQTRERLARLGLRHAELPPLADIDEPADLDRLPPSWLASRR